MRNLKKTTRFLITLIAAGALFAAFSGLALATGVTTTAAAGSSYEGWGLLAAGISTGIACIGAGIAVGGGAPAAIGALTEDPTSCGKALIFVALGEGIALYGMLISILILNKI